MEIPDTVSSRRISIRGLFRGRNGLAAVCAVSLAAYVSFSQALRYYVGGWTYHFALLRGFLAPSAKAAPEIPTLAAVPFSNAPELLLLALFIVLCLCAAVLVLRLAGKGASSGPTCILFFIASAILPTLLLALFWWPDGRGRLTSKLMVTVSGVIDLILLMTLLYLRQRRKGAPVKEGKMAPEPSDGALFYFIPAVILMLLAFGTSYGIVQGYDAIAYHLPMAASWFKHSRLLTGSNIQLFYPGNMELLLRWTLVLGTDRFAFLVPFLAAVGSLYVLYKICRSVGQPPAVAVTVTCCALTCPLLPNLATTAYNDTFGVLCLLLAVFFLIEWGLSECQSSFSLACSGLALGLAVGTKYSALPPALIITLAWLFLALSKAFAAGDGKEDEETRLHWQKIVKDFLIFSLPAVAGCLFWYLRNLLAAGNPLYPIAFWKFPGMPMRTLIGILHPGLEKPGWRWAAYPWTELGYSNVFDEGVGAVFAALAVPSFLGWLFIDKKSSPPLRLIYFITFGSFALFLWSGNFDPRYALFPILLSFLFVGEMLCHAKSLALRAITFLSYALMIFLLGEFFLGGILYEHALPRRTGAERFGVPAEVDRLRPGRVFNVAGAAYTYGLMGMDYRHEVVTLYRQPEPDDLKKFQADYVLLKNSQVPSFASAFNMQQIGGSDPAPDGLSLWQIQFP